MGRGRRDCGLGARLGGGVGSRARSRRTARVRQGVGLGRGVTRGVGSGAAVGSADGCSRGIGAAVGSGWARGRLRQTRRRGRRLGSAGSARRDRDRGEQGRHEQERPGRRRAGAQCPRAGPSNGDRARSPRFADHAGRTPRATTTESRRAGHGQRRDPIGDTLRRDREEAKKMSAWFSRSERRGPEPSGGPYVQLRGRDRPHPPWGGPQVLPRSSPYARASGNPTAPHRLRGAPPHRDPRWPDQSGLSDRLGSPRDHLDLDQRGLRQGGDRERRAGWAAGPACGSRRPRSRPRSRRCPRGRSWS